MKKGIIEILSIYKTMYSGQNQYRRQKDLYHR